MKKKKKLSPYVIAIILGFIIVAFIAVLDIKCMNSGVFGTPNDYTSGNYSSGWWNVFQFIILFIFSILSVTYYYFADRDYSEAWAVYLVPYILWMFGIADILFFWLQFKMVPGTLPWLNNNIFIYSFAFILRQPVVTNWILYLSAIVGIGLALGTAYVLKKYF